MMNRLEGKTAIVTAASRGIGLAITKAYVENGAKVYMAMRDSKKNRDLIAELQQENPLYQAVYYNAFDFESYQPMIEEVIEKEGKIDILVNNFGHTDVQRDKTLTTGDSDAFFHILNVDVASVYYTSKYTVEQMQKQDQGGSIVNISSIGGITPDIARLAYTTSKAAINSLTKSIAVQYARNQIRCNAILPGLVGTDSALQNMDERFLSTFLKHVPLNRIATPEDIAQAAVYLGSDESSFVTGELISVAGGFGKPTPIYGDYNQNQ